MIDCEVKMNKAKNTDHYPIYGTIKTSMKMRNKQQEDRGKAKKYWRPDADTMDEYNSRIFEIIWDKEEQRRKLEKQEEWQRNRDWSNYVKPLNPDEVGGKREEEECEKP